MNRQLHKTRFAEAGGVALGYLDPKYRLQDVVGCIKIHSVRVGLRRFYTAHGLASVSFTVAEELAPRGGGRQVCLE